MNAQVTTHCLDAFPEALLAVGMRGELYAANGAAAELLHLPKGGRPEVTLRELTDLSKDELIDLLRWCFATNAPVPLRIAFCPAGGHFVSLRCEGWRSALESMPVALIRVYREQESGSRFSELTRLVEELNQECLARRHSERRLSEALGQLRDINSIRDHMLAQVSHDLRTPLNAILGMTEFMRIEPYGRLGAKYAEYVEDIHHSGDLLLQLVDRVLHLAADDSSGREDTVSALADLSECLEKCRKVVEPIARMRELEIMLPADMTLPKLRADQLLVKQILMNLLGNAVKYAHRGGRIEVAVHWRKGDALSIQVRDEGPGISADRIAALNRGDVKTSAYIADEGGGGFGLALSRRSAKAIGCDLDIHSVVGQGTVASLVLPPHLIEAASDSK
ncbi:MAG: HAMP domain-containing sensor histidine kinase [Kiloniellaceae bacterium]